MLSIILLTILSLTRFLPDTVEVKGTNGMVYRVFSDSYHIYFAAFDAVKTYVLETLDIASPGECVSAPSISIAPISSDITLSAIPSIVDKSNRSFKISYFLPAGKYFSIKVYDINGQLRDAIQKGFSDGQFHTYTLELIHLQKGVYFIVLEAESQKVSNKVIIR